jgi:hypothetical protein
MLMGDRYASSFNPSILRDGRPWVSHGRFGLDQGIVVLMIENHRSGQIWRLMRGNAHVRAGLRAAGFSGGWLRGGAPRAAKRGKAGRSRG